MLTLILLALGCNGCGEDSSTQLGGAVGSDEPTTLVLASAVALPEIAPIGPDDLSAPDGPMGDGLRVLMVGPRGDQDQPLQAVAVFDRPMVALGELDAASAKVPLSCGPDLSGKARWAGTSTAVWLPEGGRFPRATEVRCTIPKGSVAVDGTALSRDVSFDFTTSRPHLRRSHPSDDGTFDPEKGVMLVFDQPVALAEVEARAEIRPAGGRPLALTARRPGADDERRMPKDADRVVILDAPFAKDTEHRVLLKAGLRGTEGPLGMAEDHAFLVYTPPPPSVVDYGPVGQDVDPYEAISLSLATETEGSELNPRISIKPAPPDGWNPAQDYSSTSWYHSVRLAPMTTYTVTVEAGAKDVYGQEYARPASWSFTTGHLDALVDAPRGPQLYPANNPPTLPVRSRNTSAVYGKVERVDADWALRNMRSWKSWEPDRERSVLGMQALYDGQTETTDKVRIDSLDLTPALVDGRGLVVVEVWSPDVRTYDGKPWLYRSLLQVSDLGTTLKLGPEGVLVWVTRLSDGTPVAGAQVTLYKETPEAALWSGATDAQGIADAALEMGDDWSMWSEPLYAVVSFQGDTSVTTLGGPHELYVYDFGVSTADATEPEQLDGYAFADRGVYKPGDTVHVAFTARIADKQGLGLPAAGGYDWRCEDARYQELAVGRGTLHAASGSGSFDVTLPDEMAMGSGHCEVSLASGDLERSLWVDVPVYAYRAPSFRVDVSAPEHLSVGDTLQATGHGRYLFGAPINGADTTWSVRAQQVDPEIPDFEGWAFSTNGGRAWWDREYHPMEQIAGGEGTLDAKGQLVASVEIPATEEPRTQRVEVEFTVTDVSRQRISNRAALLVHPADFYLGLRPTTGIGRASEPAAMELVAVSPEGEPQSGVPVEVKVARRTWDVIRQKGMDGRWSWVSTATDEVVDTRTVKSGAAPVKVDFTPAEAGYYVVQVEARDKAGRVTRSEDGLYVAGPNASWARSDRGRVELVPDKLRYNPGDTAKVLVKAPKAGMSALVTVEREGVLERRVVTLPTAAETLEIPLGEDAVPNVFLSVMLVEGAPPADSPDAGVPQHHLGYQELTVDPSGRRLDVAVRADQEVYQPGQEVEVTVAVERAGAGVADAHVVLWAVDYGVLSLTGYTLPDPFERYYRPRFLRVATSDNRTQVLDRAQYLAKGAEAGGGGGEDGPTVRSKFETTPYWNAGLSTDAQGRVTVRFTLPDNLTTFQLMAVVDEGTDAFGGASAQIQVSRPLIARPALPRVFRTGDRALAGVVVHNNRDADRKVTVNAEATGITLQGAPTTVSVPAHGAVEVPFALTEPVPGEARLRFDVAAGEDRDVVEVTVPVVRPVPAETVATAGTLTESATETLARVDGALPGVGGLSVQVTPTVLVGSATTLEYLVDYPHGCIEQTSSRLLALLVARELGPRAGADLPDEKVDLWIDGGLSRLNTFRHPSGGYAYWAGGRDPSVLGTAHAAEVLHRAGKTVDPDTVRFLREFMSGTWVPRYWSAEAIKSAQARVALSLARIGHGDAGFNARIYDQRKGMSVTAKAELVETIARTTGPDSRTAGLLREIEGYAAIDTTRVAIQEPEASRFAVLWWGDALPTAATLSAMMVAEPDHVLLPRLARGLVQARAHGRWGNTYTTARAFAALTAYVQDFEEDPATRASVKLAGQELLNAAFSEDQLQQTGTLGMDDYQGGELTITADGRLYYEARLRYGMETLPPRDEGFTLARAYGIIEGTGTSAQVTPGALLRVDLRVTTSTDRYNVAIVDPLPAGLEPVDTFFKTTASAMEGEDAVDSGAWRYGWDTGYDVPEQRTWSDWVFNHREMRDDGVYLYADYMPAGIHTYTYYARATTPGDYAHPAATVEEMYAPEIFGRTAAGRFVVGEGPVASQ
ncbi:MAG: Ig-like domain-containing protein [Alphaproteobacteria bacterium]|nr:Ig-like domain-containing protein [Alphaproteobacteria bacterium]